MKVTIVVGGRWHAFNLARELQQAGHLHRLITNYPVWFVKRWGIGAEKIVSLPMTFWLVKAIYKLGGEGLMMKCQWHVHRWFARRAARHLDGSDIIHGWSQWSEPSLMWAKQRDIPAVLERSSAHILEQSRLLREEYSRLGLEWTATHPQIEEMELREYELCNQVAVPSLFVERSFVERGWNATDLVRNTLGVDLERFTPPRHTPSPPDISGLRVIYAGTLSVRKGIPDLIDGFKQANLGGSTLTLVGGKTTELKTLIEQQGSQVKCIGHRPQTELVEHYRNAHCFAIASVEEGMAMVQMQALACGLPLICTTNTGGEDLLRMQCEAPVTGPMGIKCFPAGYVVPIRAPAAIAWCLEELQGLWEKKRESALELAQRKLSWEAYGQRAIQMYTELLK